MKAQHARKETVADAMRVTTSKLERTLREQLSIPSDAERVIVFGESSHWDTNWLRTSEEYFRDHIDGIFDAIFAALARDPRRVFAIESVFFLKLYWERRPHRRELLRELLTSRRLRLLSASITTPDTLLPPTESIVRDFLMGQAWLEDNDISLSPATAYFPDNFGHSPALPTLMRSLGIDHVGITRIDGMYFIGSDYRARGHFPLKGSTAEQLEREHKTLDFVWRSDDGAEILCHWNKFTYFQGDMLAHAGVIRWMGKTFGVPMRHRGHVNRRIRRYAKELSELSLTPYLFCPIGCDFNAPIHDLGALIERYNREVYERTGVYAVVAALDDYLALVDCHREKLPVLAADPNPYWMGFYSSRPEVKQRPTKISRTLVLAEQLAARGPKDDTVAAHLDRAWSHLLLSNHHDYITGTSPDRVWQGEQRAWLDEAERAAAAAWKCLTPALVAAPAPTIVSLRHHMEAGELVVETAHYRFTLSPKRGGCLTSLGGELQGLGNDLLVYEDSGGLWRMGHEYVGGKFDRIARASDARAEIAVHEHPGELTIVVTQTLLGSTFSRTLWCRGDSPFIRMRVQGAPKPRWTVTVCFETALRATRLSMDGPGGRAERPAQKLYDPTFWPVSSHCRVSDAAGDRHGHFLFDTPAAFAFRRGGEAEWIVARNAIKERAFGVLPVLAHPIGGTSHEEQIFDYAVSFGARDLATHEQATAWLPEAERHALQAVRDLVRCDDPSVRVSAVKHARDGRGVIVRLTRGAGATSTAVALSCADRRIENAWVCDARERDGEALAPNGASVTVPLRHGLSTVRLMLAAG